MKRMFVGVICVLTLFAVCSCEPEVLSGSSSSTSGPSNPKVFSCLTGTASDITFKSATLNGSIPENTVGQGNATVWFRVGTDRSSVTGSDTKASVIKTDAITVSASGDSFSTTLTSLTPQTTYYYMACAMYNEEEVRGNVSTFITSAKPKTTVITGGASDITESSAQLVGYLNPDLVDGVNSYGFLYSTDPNPDRTNGSFHYTWNMDQDMMFYATISRLYSNTKYYYRAFLYDNNSADIQLGEVKSFTTARGALISIDGNFSDWDSLKSNEYSMVSSASNNYLKVLKACADKDALYIFTSFDCSKVGDAEFGTMSLYIDNDNNSSTGFDRKEWRGNAAHTGLDILLDYQIIDYDYILGWFTSSAYYYDNEEDRQSWSWYEYDGYDYAQGYCHGTNILAGTLELKIEKSLFPNDIIPNQFSIGLLFNVNDWNDLNCLPASSLLTVKKQ